MYIHNVKSKNHNISNKIKNSARKKKKKKNIASNVMNDNIMAAFLIFFL